MSAQKFIKQFYILELLFSFTRLLYINDKKTRILTGHSHENSGE